MKVNSTSVFIGESLYTDSDRKSGNSFCGNALREKLDPISVKKEKAKKSAMKLIKDAFDAECKIDNDLNERRDRVKKLTLERQEADKSIRQLEADRSALREEYGITEDSQEERNLKLLEKEIRSKMPGSDVSLTKDDIEQIAAIKKNGLSEYQERSLEMLKFEEPYMQTIVDAKKEIIIENSVIDAIELERLKSHALKDAENQADDIMEAASKEAIHMMMDELKEHIEEVAEEAEEKADEKRAKEEELEERIEKVREENKDKEELTEDLLDGIEKMTLVEQDVSSVQQDITDMLNKMGLLEDDIKGATVDESL